MAVFVNYIFPFLFSFLFLYKSKGESGRSRVSIHLTILIHLGHLGLMVVKSRKALQPKLLSFPLLIFPIIQNQSQHGDLNHLGTWGDGLKMGICVCLMQKSPLQKKAEKPPKNKIIIILPLLVSLQR